MYLNSKGQLIEIPISGAGGLVWNRLHSEREDICEAMIKDYRMGFGADLSREAGKVTAENCHQELLHARLRKIDDALDRVMSGSYGHCSKCNRDIESGGLEFDPALVVCRSCSEQKRGWAPVLDNSAEPDSNPNVPSTQNEVVIEGMEKFDTILVRTLNTDYRILLIDPKTGRALVEGGQYFVEPREVWLSGSQLHDSAFKFGSIAVGYHLEMWVGDSFVRTSRVQSMRVEHPESAESIEAITETIH